MAITFGEAGAVASTASSTQLAVTLPANIAANDLCIWHTHAQKSTLAHVYPAGWSTGVFFIEQSVSSRTVGVSFAWRRMDGSTSGTVAVSHGGASTCVLMSAITRWVGVTTNAGNPYEVRADTSAASSVYTSDGLAITEADRMCLALVSNTDDQATWTAFASGANIGAISTAYNTEVSLGNGSMLVLNYGQATSSGTVEFGVSTMGTVETWAALEIALIASTEVAAGYWTPTTFSLLGVQ